MKRILLAGVLSGVFLSANAQTTADTVQTTPKPAAEKNELKYNLNESGTHYFKATFLNQTWVRFNDNNPGTQVNGVSTDQTVDIGLRRTRIQLFGQLNDRTFLYFQFGQNNFNFLNGYGNANGAAANRKIAAFFHDAIGEYHVFKGKDYLKLGGGLTIANGLSRFSQPSVSTILTMDVPVFAQATVDQTDQFSRKLSVYARGQVGKLDYRLAVSDPFPIQSSGAAPGIGPNATFALKGHHKQYQALLLYQFLDKESHITPGYTTGTYLGKKKILNLEAGIIGQRRATWHTEGTDTVYNRMLLWSVAAFYDAPVNTARGTAISAYAGYYNYDFGPGYLRYNGIMNPANGTVAASAIPGQNSWGNAFPMFGTGSVIYAQLGYLLPQMGEMGQLQPYASLMHANYKRLNKPMSVFDIGINWLIRGHNSKFSLDYQHRPVYQVEAGNTFRLEKTSSRGSVVLQYQVFI